MKYKKHFDKFIKQLNQRLTQGHYEYQDKSFDRPVADLIAEIQEECLDIAGWGLILWAKLEEKKSKSCKNVYLKEKYK